MFRYHNAHTCDNAEIAKYHSQGRIIDHYFPSMYQRMELLFQCDSRNVKYVPAPEMTQNIMIEIFLRPLKKQFGDLPLADLVTKATNYSRHDEALESMCFQNAIMEIAKGGGELVFGSIGFKFRNRDGYHYEFGGEDWKTIAQFMK